MNYSAKKSLDSIRKCLCEDKQIHGSFQSGSWYKSPSIWHSVSKRFAELECPIFAADAAMEAAKEGLKGLIWKRMVGYF